MTNPKVTDSNPATWPCATCGQTLKPVPNDPGYFYCPNCSEPRP